MKVKNQNPEQRGWQKGVARLSVMRELRKHRRKGTPGPGLDRGRLFTAKYPPILKKQEKREIGQMSETSPACAESCLD